jgi:hypothetical protein
MGNLLFQPKIFRGDPVYWQGRIRALEGKLQGMTGARRAHWERELARCRRMLARFS